MEEEKTFRVNLWWNVPITDEQYEVIQKTIQRVNRRNPENWNTTEEGVRYHFEEYCIREIEGEIDTFMEPQLQYLLDDFIKEIDSEEYRFDFELM